jgi:hypothetical protein
MDFSNAKELIAIFATSVISLVLGIISIIRSGRMLPKDIKGAELANEGTDLNNKDKEISIAQKYETLADRASDKVIAMQKQLNENTEQSIILSGKMSILQTQYEILKEKLENQELIIQQQSLIIEEQSKRIDLQDKKIKEQQEEIALLRCELNKTKVHNSNLRNQIIETGGSPVAPPLIDCEEEAEKKKQEENIARIKRSKNGNKI